MKSNNNLKPDIKNLKPAKRYSNALLESAGDLRDEILSDLDKINEIFNNNVEFQMFFKHPSVSLKDKKETLKDIFQNKINPKTFDFLNVLLDENRFDIFNSIYNVFKTDIQILKNQQNVFVTSAVELDEDEKEKIKQKLALKLNKEVILSCLKDEDILGGLIIKINDNIIDLSLKTKFDNLKKYN